jgi:concentrative nucleoside transporter, CNT family
MENDEEKNVPEGISRKVSQYSASVENPPKDAQSGPIPSDDEQVSAATLVYRKYRPFILAAVAMVIIGWWISSIVLKATRHRWIVQTLFAWFFVLVIAFRFIPNSVVTKPVGTVWEECVQNPFYKLPYYTRLSLGWLCLVRVAFDLLKPFESIPAYTAWHCLWLCFRVSPPREHQLW